MSTSNKSFLKQPNKQSILTTSGNNVTPKKLATTLESDEFEYETKQTDRSIDDLVRHPQLKDISNRYSDDFDESKQLEKQQKASIRESYENNDNNFNNSTMSSIHVDNKRKSLDKTDKEDEEEEEEELSEQMSSSRPSQQSVIQKKPHSKYNTEQSKTTNNNLIRMYSTNL